MTTFTKWKLASECTSNRVSVKKYVNFEFKSNFNVSVIIPIYNAENTIKECLDSVINQSLKEIEIICVNDGSKDNSLELIEQYAENDSRIRIIDKENAGYGHSVNIGIDHASGKYIGIVESDDYVEQNMYKNLYNVAESFDLDFVKSDFNRFVIKDGKKEFKRINVAFKNYYWRKINPQLETEVRKFNMQTWCGIYKKEFLVKNNIRHNETPGASFQDNGFFIKTYALANSIMYVNQSYYRYRFDNPLSSMHDKSKVYAIKTEFDLIEKYLYENNLMDEKNVNFFYWKKYKSYLLTVSRIDDDAKSEFIKLFSDEYKTLIDNGIIDKSYYSDEEYYTLSKIVYDSDKYISKLLRPIKVSIIVPCYNSEMHLIQCLDSICNQTIKEIEIICINDGSNDETLNILRDYAEKDDRILIINYEKNRGVSTSRNNALDIARGEYVAFMDSDDWYPSNSTIEMLYNKAKDNSAKICGGSFSELYEGKLISNYTDDFYGYTFHEEGYINYVDYQFDFGFHRFLYSLDLIKTTGIRFPNYIRYQDPIFFIKIMDASGTFYAIPDIVYCYRRNNNVIWNSYKVSELNNALADVLEFSIAHKYWRLYMLAVNRIEKKYNKINVNVFNPHNEKYINSISRINSIIITNNETNIESNNYLWKLLVNDSNIRRRKLKEKYDNEIKQVRNEMDCIKNSASYKIGRVITWLPRKIISIIKSN